MAKIYIGPIFPGGGGGVAPNPTSGTMPVQLGGIFKDSLLQSTDDVGNGTYARFDDTLQIIVLQCATSTILMDGGSDDVRINATNGLQLNGGVFVNNHLGNAILRFLSSGASHPALKAVGNVLQVRLANDSGDADLTARSVTASGKVNSASDFQIVGRSQISSLVDSNLTMYNAGKTAFNLLQFGGVTASFPAIKRNGTALEIKLADDSGFANLIASNLTSDAGNISSNNTNIQLRISGTTTILRGQSTGVQIANGATTPNASAQLDVVSTTRGFLPPRMTQAQRTAIVSPAVGLIVMQNDPGNEGLYVYKTSGWTLIV